ncbi:cuticle protein 19.8-like [Anabrus simplex]|uniref:cuticle protein 19.8-like n=1 Tax=Anabrus simplex TaxID=316456 RepID=UPI0035A2CF35
MAYRFIVLAALVAVAKAGILGAPAVYAPGAPLAARAYAAPAYAHAPVAYAAGPAYAHAPVAYAAAPAVAKVAAPVAVDTDYDPNPSYSYAYDIQDALTGDSKGQQESRQGDVVQGSYSLVEPDGTRRTVEYTADPVNGFNAVVHREPAVVAKAVVAAPAVAKVAAPVAYAAPAYAHPAAYGAPIAAKAYLEMLNIIYCNFLQQFFVLAALVAVAKAGILGAPAVYAPGAPLAARAYAAPVAYAAAPAYAKVAAPVAVDTDYDPNPSYNYAYDIQDALTGDSKGQQESRQGDVVQGSYSLVEPDGTRRTVEYTADPVNGFNAVVHREPAVVAKAVVAAPAVAKVAAPLAYAAPAYGYGKALIG